jgi:hypothetical protein
MDVPISALIVRFFHLGTYSVIRAAPGCGETLYGNSMLTYTSDTFQRVLYSQYSMYFDSYISNTEEVFIADK